MPETEPDASDVIRAYRRRRERTVPLLLGGLAVVLLVVGIFLIVIWVTGGSGPALPSFLATDTPTPTHTFTPLPPTDTPTITPTSEPSETPTPEGPITYIVEEGDSLFTIAEQFEVDIDLLIASNPELTDAAIIFVGQELIIPSPDTEFPSPTPLPLTLIPGSTIDYTVRAGDTLETIAALFNSTAEAIAEENDIEDPNSISVGQVLTVPVGIATPTPSATPDPNTPTATLIP